MDNDVYETVRTYMEDLLISLIEYNKSKHSEIESDNEREIYNYIRSMVFMGRYKYNILIGMSIKFCLTEEESKEKIEMYLPGIKLEYVQCRALKDIDYLAKDISKGCEQYKYRKYIIEKYVDKYLIYYSKYTMQSGDTSFVSTLTDAFIEGYVEERDRYFISIILALKEFGNSKEVIFNKLVNDFCIVEDEADYYISNYY